MDLLVVTTNFDFQENYTGDLAELESVKQMRKVLALFADYCKEAFYKDKIGAVINMYTGEMMF